MWPYLTWIGLDYTHLNRGLLLLSNLEYGRDIIEKCSRDLNQAARIVRAASILNRIDTEVVDAYLGIPCFGTAYAGVCAPSNHFSVVRKEAATCNSVGLKFAVLEHRKTW